MTRIAIVDGIRTPFMKAGSLFQDMTAHQLGAMVVRELLERTSLDPELVDEVVMGCVANPVEAANVGRVISLLAGIPERKRAYTVSRNCASGFESITSASEKIATSFDEIVIAGGAESMSNIPLLFGREMSKQLTRLAKAKTPVQKLGALASFRPRHFKPLIGVMLGLTDPVCGLNMGQTAEVVAKELGITREEQDQFALMSHERSIAAREKLSEEIMPVLLPPKYKVLAEKDNGPREGQTIEALQKLRPFFDRKTATVTVGNACPVTDGAAVVLMMTEQKAKQLGYEPLGFIKSYTYEGLAPNKMGLGPAYAIPVSLKKAGLKLKDIELVEINEAFAAQVLGSLKLMKSKEFAKDVLGESEPVGDLDTNILNVNGGAIAVGHPVGVTGTRLVLTLLKEMKRRNVKYGVASLCIGGGQGGAVVLER